jgi:hypothetical protein
VATERQIAANRRNARKSSGPRTRAGKSRASRNRYRHGLSVRTPTSAEDLRRLDSAERQIAGNSEDPALLTRARSIAEADLELTLIRRTKVALLRRVHVFGGFGPWLPFASHREALRFVGEYKRGTVTRMPDELNAAATMPNSEPERTSEAIRRALPEMLALDRFERRAAARRERAVREFVAYKIFAGFTDSSTPDKRGRSRRSDQSS